MSLSDALMFVNKMKEDNHFREKALGTSTPEDLSLFLHSKGLQFDQRELVGAMAECMTQMEQQMGN
jgi:predicted ribosomally synthesized peptide with nif11-like leader